MEEWIEEQNANRKSGFKERQVTRKTMGRNACNCHTKYKC